MYIGCATMKDGSTRLFYAEDFAEVAVVADKYMQDGACRVDVAQIREAGEKVEC